MHVDGGPLVQKGAHLARIGDCMGCHTQNEDKPYAGNKPMASPFGTFYTSNITPDKKTGIGTWTYEDFKRALHHGKRKSGNYIYPAMPFVSYTYLKEEDVKALWAYFQAVQPIENKVRDPDMMIIGDHFSSLARLGLLGWRIPFFNAERFKPEPGRSDEYNKGKYYVQALGHCSSCHTPRNIAFAEIPDEFLNGFTLNGWYAPKISPGRDSAIKHWSVDDLTTFLKEGELGKQTTVVGPMHEVWRDSLRHLPREDLRAIAVYLKTMPDNNKTPSREPIAITSQQASLGSTVYQQHCMSCHGDDGQGTYGVAPALDGNNLVRAADANSVVMSVLVGFDPEHVWGAMPSFAKQLSDQEIAAVSNYIRTAWGNKARADATVDMVASSRSHAASSIPPGGQRPAVICPNLPADVIRPALKPGEKTLLSAYDDAGTLSSVVQAYQSARPDAPSGDTIKALTAAYCRALVKQPDTPADKRKTQVFNFSQKVAETLNQ